MELIFLIAKIFQHLFITPVWWVSVMLASIFYPFEGDKRQDGLALLFATLITALLIAAILWYF